MKPWWTVEFDPGDETQWYLKGPRSVDERANFDMWQFVRGEPADPNQRLQAVLRRPASALDWTFAS